MQKITTEKKSGAPFVERMKQVKTRLAFNELMERLKAGDFPANNPRTHRRRRRIIRATLERLEAQASARKNRKVRNKSLSAV